MNKEKIEKLADKYARKKGYFLTKAYVEAKEFYIKEYNKGNFYKLKN